MPDEGLEAHVLRVIGRTFSLAPNEVTPELSMGSHPRWDSMGHMELIAELENEFKVSFPGYALAELTNADVIARKITECRSV